MENEETARIELKVPAIFKKRAQGKAKKHKQSLNKYIETVVEKDMDAEDKLDADNWLNG